MPLLPTVFRVIHALALPRPQDPPGAELVAVLADEAGDRKRHLARVGIGGIVPVHGGLDVGMLATALERGRGSTRICDPGRHLGAHVVPAARPQPVDATLPLVLVKLGGVLKAAGAQHDGLFIHPALMPDLPMRASLVARREDPLHLRTVTLHYLKPGPVVTVLLDVTAGVLKADIGQPRELRLEVRQFLARNVELTVPVPARLSRLPKVGIRHAPCTCLNGNIRPGTPVPVTDSHNLRWPIDVKRPVNRTHAKIMHAQ